MTASPSAIDLDGDDIDGAGESLPNAPAIREGSYFIASNTALMQMVDGGPVTITVRKGRSADGVSDKHARIIRKLIPIRDAVREVLKAQELDRPWKPAQVKLRIAWSNFVRDFGPINTTVVSTSEDPETGEVRETHRRPNLQPFLDDPDCWLVASIEDYDLETDTARPGPIFTERVIAPPSAPIITSAADALAVVLNERGHVDLDHIAELLHRRRGRRRSPTWAMPSSAIPATGIMADGRRLSLGPGPRQAQVGRGGCRVSIPPSSAMSAPLSTVQPADLGPSDITARLGAPWIPAADVVAFVKETMGAEIRIHHMPELASWTVEARQLGYMAAGTSEWGTERRHAGELHRRCAEQPRAADLRHHQGGPGARGACSMSSRPRRRRKSSQDQDGVPDLDLVRSRSHRPAGADL